MKILALALFAFGAIRTFGADTVGTHYDLSKAVAFIAVQEQYGGADREVQYFTPLKTKFTAEGELSKLCKAIEGAETVAAGQGPMVGHLCHFVLVDKDKEILGMVSILNFNCLCDIYGARRDAKGRIVADYGKKAFGFTSRELARAFYDRLKKEDPAYMTKKAAYYAEAVKTVEGLLFGNNTGEQDGADQPATAPKSKPESKAKPQPESKAAPR